MGDRSKAFFINGGAGRVLCSIPALEKYAEDSGDKDFVIVCESGMDFYRGHPTLHKHAFESWHKGLFQDYLKDKSMSIDVKSFDSEMLIQKSRARKNWKGTGDIKDSSLWFEVTKDLEFTLDLTLFFNE